MACEKVMCIAGSNDGIVGVALAFRGSGHEGLEEEGVTGARGQGVDVGGRTGLAQSTTKTLKRVGDDAKGSRSDRGSSPCALRSRTFTLAAGQDLQRL